MLINDNSRPLIFIGTNSNLYQYIELCQTVGIEIAGIIDSDYFGNTQTYCDLPVIDSEIAFDDAYKLAHYKQNFNFFCAVNWSPITVDRVYVRNREKRNRLIDQIDHCGLPCISLISPNSCISPSAEIGRGVFVDNLVNVEPKVIVGDFTTIYSYTLIGHTTKIGRNCVFQRHSVLSNDSIVENEVYFSPMVKCTKGGIRISTNTFVHEGVYMRRGTLPNEIVSLTAENKNRVTFLEVI